MDNTPISVLLHLSDLHFGWSGEPAAEIARTEVLNALVKAVKGVEAAWRPTIVCVTGDIGWAGKEKDYESALPWFRFILSELHLPPEALFFCPGNHDSDRSHSRSLVRPSRPDEADRVLDAPIGAQYARPFQSYSNFCQQLGVPPYVFEKEDSYLIGRRNVGAIELISINSAWFAMGDDDKGQLWMGLPLVRRVMNTPPSNKTPISVVLMHHPREWHASAEVQVVGAGRPNTFDYLVRRANLLLTGHTHGEVRRGDRFAENCWHLSGGASYAGAAHTNSFRLVRLFDAHFEYQSYEYDPTSADSQWQIKHDLVRLTWEEKPTPTHAKYIEESAVRISYSTQHQGCMRDYVQSFLEEKIEILGTGAVVPGLVPLLVELHQPELTGPQERQSPYDARKNQRTVRAIEDVILNSRRTAIFGDLGSGKSTLVAQFVHYAIREIPEAITCLVPAKRLKVEGNLDIHGFLDAVSGFLHEEVYPRHAFVSVKQLLERASQVILVIDGLDEVPRRIASEIVSCLDKLPNHWASATVVATSRPLEIASRLGMAWTIVSPAEMSHSDKKAILQFEATRWGRSKSEAETQAEAMFMRLANWPALESVASTPLALRLIAKWLSEHQTGDDGSVGDMLYDLVLERIGNWASRDRKQLTTDQFENEFPSAGARAEIGGLLAYQAFVREALTVESARVYLQEHYRGRRTPELLADETLNFLRYCGLIAFESGSVQFPYQPLFEMLVGIGLAQRWISESEGGHKILLSDWRCVSFAAAVVRRWGKMESCRSSIDAYLVQVSTSENHALSGAFVVSEAKDTSLALSWIAMLSNAGGRPIHIRYAEPRSYALAWAIAIIENYVIADTTKVRPVSSRPR